jgi:hypothetical protein
MVIAQQIINAFNKAIFIIALHQAFLSLHLKIYFLQPGFYSFVLVNKIENK